MTETGQKYVARSAAGYDRPMSERLARLCRHVARDNQASGVSARLLRRQFAGKSQHARGRLAAVPANLVALATADPLFLAALAKARAGRPRPRPAAPPTT